MVKSRRTVRAPRRSRAALTESTLLTGIKQGAAMVTAKSFGSARKPKRVVKARLAKHPGVEAFDAMHPAHLSLPRPVGAYTVVRTTQVIATSNHSIILGPFQVFDSTFNNQRWTNVCAVSSVDSSLPINNPTNMHRHVFDQMNMSATSWAQSTLTPAAFSVQIINSEALQATTGAVLAGRAKTMPKIRNDTRSWDTYMTELIGYNQPRVCMAAKLALRGVQADLIPFNMSALADFRQVSQYNENPGVTFDVVQPDLSGFAPVFVRNPGGILLTYLVTCEWRVRFDPSNPAQATHSRHPCSSDQHWENCISALEAGANGVVDIAEKVARVGQAAAKIGSLLA